jgi:hypothetical protein
MTIKLPTNKPEQLEAIKKYILDHPPFQIKDPANIPLSIEDPERDKKIITNNLMRELCQMDKYARRNGHSNEFNIESITSIQAFGKKIIHTFIEEFDRKTGYIQILPNGKIRLTELGRNHCSEFI